jgi:glucose-1-phosphate adenylyltransferase
VFAENGRRMGIALNSIVSPGCIIAGGVARNCVLSSGVKIESFSEVESSIVLPNVSIGSRCRIRRAIVSEDVEIADDTEIGFDTAQDQSRGYTVTAAGIVVVPSAEPMARAVPSARVIRTVARAASSTGLGFPVA